jgi:uncharacterized protein
MDIIGVEWDPGNIDKCQKHGVAMAEVDALLMGTPMFAPDIKHSTLEQRFVAVGRTAQGRAMFVAFTLRHYSDGIFVRPVSARYMHRKEAEAYEKKST